MSKLLSQPKKKGGFSFDVNNISILLNYSNCVRAWNIALISGVLLDRVESKAISLIGDPSLTSTLDPLSLRRKVASLFLFYRYYFGHCSDELAACIAPPMARPRSTRQATFAHNYCVELSNARINRLSDGFFPSTLSPFFCISSFLQPSFLQKAVLSPP